MKKRIYQAVSVNKINADLIAQRSQDAGGRVVFGCDAAKDIWYGALVDDGGEVLATIRWDVIKERDAVTSLLSQLREAGVEVEVAVEPTGTYADAMCSLLLSSGYDVYRISAKHSHDYQEIYDGVPSGHDAKSAAIVAELHMNRRPTSHRWKLVSDERRTLRVATDSLHWLQQDENRYHNRLESRLARHWPEFGRVLELDRISALELLARYGCPLKVDKAAGRAKQLLRRSSRGNLSEEKTEALLASAGQSMGVVPNEAERLQICALAGKLIELRKEKKRLEKELKRQADENAQVGQMAPVVGTATAAVFFAILGDFRDYGSVRAIHRAVGVNLKIRSSGKYKGHLKIVKRGSSTVRRWLFMATLRWLYTDPIARAWYQRKVASSGGIKHKAIVALMRKLLAGLYHVARGEKFDSSKLFDTSRLNVQSN